MKTTSIEEFYKEINANLPVGISKEIGHFNVFDIAKMFENMQKTRAMPYNRRAYYKISFINGKTEQNMPIRSSILKRQRCFLLLQKYLIIGNHKILNNPGIFACLRMNFY